MVVQCSTSVDKKKKRERKIKTFWQLLPWKNNDSNKERMSIRGWRQMARRPMKIVIRIKRPCTGIITRKITGACQVCICPFCVFTKPCNRISVLHFRPSWPNITKLYIHNRCNHFSIVKLRRLLSLIASSSSLVQN